MRRRCSRGSTAAIRSSSRSNSATAASSSARVPCDADWSNLPMRPFYLPLLQRLSRLSRLHGFPAAQSRRGQTARRLSARRPMPARRRRSSRRTARSRSADREEGRARRGRVCADAAARPLHADPARRVGDALRRQRLAPRVRPAKADRRRRSRTSRSRTASRSSTPARNTSSSITRAATAVNSGVRCSGCCSRLLFLELFLQQRFARVRRRTAGRRAQAMKRAVRA